METRVVSEDIRHSLDERKKQEQTLEYVQVFFIGLFSGSSFFSVWPLILIVMFARCARSS